VINVVLQGCVGGRVRVVGREIVLIDRGVRLLQVILVHKKEKLILLEHFHLLRGKLFP